MVINLVASIPTSGKKELQEYPDVIAVDRPYTNLANITQYLEAVIPTLNYEISSTSRNTVSMKKVNIPCPSAFFLRYNMNYTYEVQYIEGGKRKIVSFKKMPELSIEKMCVNEGKPCYGQTVTKCKTYKEDKILVRLRIEDGHVSFVDSKRKVKKIAVGKYCKCQI